MYLFRIYTCSSILRDFQCAGRSFGPVAVFRLQQLLAGVAYRDEVPSVVLGLDDHFKARSGRRQSTSTWVHAPPEPASIMRTTVVHHRMVWDRGIARHLRRK